VSAPFLDPIFAALDWSSSDAIEPSAAVEPSAAANLPSSVTIPDPNFAVFGPAYNPLNSASEPNLVPHDPVQDPIIVHFKSSSDSVTDAGGLAQLPAQPDASSPHGSPDLPNPSPAVESPPLVSRPEPSWQPEMVAKTLFDAPIFVDSEEPDVANSQDSPEPPLSDTSIQKSDPQPEDISSEELTLSKPSTSQQLPDLQQLARTQRLPVPEQQSTPQQLPDLQQLARTQRLPVPEQQQSTPQQLPDLQQLARTQRLPVPEQQSTPQQLPDLQQLARTQRLPIPEQQQSNTQQPTDLERLARTQKLPTPEQQQSTPQQSTESSLEQLARTKKLPTPEQQSTPEQRDLLQEQTPHQPSPRTLTPDYTATGILRSVTTSDGQKFVMTADRKSWCVIDRSGNQINTQPIKSVYFDKRGNLIYITASGTRTTMYLDGTTVVE
jgi:hypothetical protein